MEAKRDARNDARTRPVTRLLREAGEGDGEAFDRLVPFVYDELRRLAERYLRRERKGHTLQTTALVHEAFLKLVDQERIQWQDRAHFFAVAATCMRRLLVDHARRKRALKRGEQAKAMTIDRLELPGVNGIDDADDAIDVVDLGEAMERLAVHDPRKVRVLELRFFGGLENTEIAELIQVSLGTVERDLRLARAWLLRELSRGTA